MGPRMHWLRVVGFAFVSGVLSLSCAKGKDVKSAGREDKLAFDEDGKGKKCEDPKSTCDEVTDPSLDFKEKCREAGFRMKQCGCDNLCTGNIKGDRHGYSSKNQLKTCKTDSKETCEMQETSAAYQDACDGVGGEMMECGCEWLCSKKLREAIPDPVKEEEKKADDEAGGEKKKDDKAKEEKKPHGNMDGRSSDEIAKDKEKAAKDKAAKDKAAKDKADDEKKDEGGTPGKRKKTGRFFDPE